MVRTLLVALALWSGAAAAQWPNRTLTLVAPFAAGGGVDTSARLQAQALAEILGQSIIVENIGAASGTVGTAKVASAEPDGYTFLIGNTGTHVFTHHLYKKSRYHPIHDFAPIALVTDSPRILIARKDLPVAGLKEFIAYAKANHSKMQFGSSGVGGGTHLPCVLLNRALGIEPVHVPYRGAGPAMQDLIGGRIDYMCDTIQTGAIQAKKGTVRGIAVMAPQRVAAIAELATTGEQGLAGMEASVWNALFFPKGTPAPIRERMSKAVGDMLDNPAMRKRLEDLGLEVATPERRRPEFLTKLIGEELERWGKVIREAGITPE